MKILTAWLTLALAIAISALLLPGISVDGLWPLIILSAVMGIINTFIRPILMFLTLPISIVTLGIFALVLNTLLIQFADWLIEGVSIDNFWWALLFGIVLAIVHSILKNFGDED